MNKIKAVLREYGNQPLSSFGHKKLTEVRTITITDFMSHANYCN